MHDQSQPVSLTDGAAITLIPHSAHPPLMITAVRVRMLAMSAHWLSLRWRIEGATSVVIPPFAGRGRADGLWRTTCFELFVADEGEGGGYAEFNLSPSERWASYDFSGYRAGMRERPMPRDPVCTLRNGTAVLLFEAAIPRAAMPPLPARTAISAVIEEAGSVKSYWALAHPEAAPDFHDPLDFTLQLG